MSYPPEYMSEQQLAVAMQKALPSSVLDVDFRRAVLAEVDAAECGACGSSAGPASAESAEWFIDAEVGPAGTTLAVIRCPLCW